MKFGIEKRRIGALARREADVKKWEELSERQNPSPETLLEAECETLDEWKEYCNRKKKIALTDVENLKEKGTSYGDQPSERNS